MITLKKCYPKFIYPNIYYSHKCLHKKKTICKKVKKFIVFEGDKIFTVVILDFTMLSIVTIIATSVFKKKYTHTHRRNLCGVTQ